MRILVAGATGAIGRKLVPLLVARRHQVFAATRSRNKLGSLDAQGAEPVLMDGLNRAEVMKVVVAAIPEVVIHEMSSLASMRDLKRFDDEFAVTNCLRTDGTKYLLEAARAVGARQFIAQSYTGWPNERRGGRVKTEDDPLDDRPPAAMSKTLAGIRTLERMVTTAEGITGTVLRYGSLYGPGTSLSDHGDIVQLVRARRLPIVGGGTGVWSFVHVSDAARATVAAVNCAAPGIYNVVDDEPAEVSEWLPELASAVGARPPWRIPTWIGRFALGEPGVSMMTQIRGSSNARAKRVLGWIPSYPTWRDGFLRGLQG